MNARKAFAIAAHPDDIEFMMSGTLALLKNAGWEIHYMNLANGALGSMTLGREDAASLRRSESIASCEICGAHYHESISEDLSIFYDSKTLAHLVETIREVSPEIILTHGPYDYMEDHVVTGRLVSSAAFCRGMPNFRNVSLPAVEGECAVYHAMPHSISDALNRPVKPDFFVDIESVAQIKRDMLSCHASQKDWLDITQGQGAYLEAMRFREEYFGKMSGRFHLAEGWIRHNPLGYCAENFDPLREELKGFCL